MAKKSYLVHPITKMPKHCYWSDGWMRCTFTERDGKIWRYSKIFDYIKFRSKRKKGFKSEESPKIEKEPVIQAGSLSNQ